MVLEPQGFVARIAEDLERSISQERLPKDGSLPSEQSLARFYGVSRTTVREALRHLAARGVVVQHPGRRSRAARLDVAVTLENLSVALHAMGPAHPERLRLLEGYLTLKRETAVELLADCCEHVSKADLDPLVDACFSLADAARWKPEGQRWAEQEFGLLRLAACIAGRPGHFLLIQSLERSFWGMAGRLVPHLDSKAMYQWAMCAFHALNARDAQAMRRELPALLRACDERLLSSLMPGHEAGDTPEVSSRAAEPRSGEMPEPQVLARAKSPDPVPVPKGAEDSEPDAHAREALEACAREESPEPGPTPMDVERAASEPPGCKELPSFAVDPLLGERPTLEPTPHEELPAPTTAPPGVEMSELTSAAERELAGSVCTNRSACRTASCKARPTGDGEPCEVGVERLSCRPQAP